MSLAALAALSSSDLAAFLFRLDKKLSLCTLPKNTELGINCKSLSSKTKTDPDEDDECEEGKYSLLVTGVIVTPLDVVYLHRLARIHAVDAGRRKKKGKEGDVSESSEIKSTANPPLSPTRPLVDELVRQFIFLLICCLSVCYGERVERSKQHVFIVGSSPCL